MSGQIKTKVFVGNLPDNCTDEDLRRLFERYGDVTECDVINNYGFVHYAIPKQADEAVENLNKHNFMGSTITVEFARSKLHPEPGAPGRANRQTVMNRRGGGPSRHSYVPLRGGRGFDGRRMDQGAFHDRRFGFRARLRPYEPSMPPMREEYPRRPMGCEPYSRHQPPMGRNDNSYSRRPMTIERTFFSRTVTHYYHH